MTNAKTILDFVNEVSLRTPDRDLALSLDWFRWAMLEMHKAEECNNILNPSWLRANGRIISFGLETEPIAMFHDLGPKQIAVVRVDLNENTSDQESASRGAD